MFVDTTGAVGNISSFKSMLVDTTGAVGNISPFKSSSAWLKVKDAVHLEKE